MPLDQRLELATRLALQEIGDTPAEMPPVSADMQLRPALACRDAGPAAQGRIMHDQVRHAAQRDADAGSDLGMFRHLLQALLEPALVAVEEAVELDRR